MTTPTTKALQWVEADYAPIITGSGARKLSTSAVAPLVAAGRGMLDITRDNLKQMQAFLGTGAGNSRPSKCIANAVGQTDALYMPWFTSRTVADMRLDGKLWPSAAPQFRPNPQNVKYDENGKGAKYINMSGCPPIIGLHPATPASWQASRGLRAMFTEGMIKADAALTAMLLDAGVTADELRLSSEDLRDGASDMERAWACRSRLETLMERVPDTDRIMIYGFLSVTTFSRNPEWLSVDVRDHDVYIAFDGDTATNPNVWRQGKQLFEFIGSTLKATPKLIDLSSAVLPDDPNAKCGMDDYLAAVGDWRSLLNLAVDKLPPRPEDDQAVAGQWRMNEKTLVTEEFVPGPTADDPGSWREKYPFVARVRTVEDRRQVLPIEAETGEYVERTDAKDMDTRVEIEVSWMGADNKPCIGVISGPQELLSAPVSEWRRINPKPATPSHVALLPAWPPREPEFLAAMKRYRVADRVNRPLWNHMGWVPTKDDVPVFLVGDQVIGADGLMPAAAASAVNGAELKPAAKYGVQLPDDEDEVRDAFMVVMDAYRPENQAASPFRNPRHASIILAAALRPCAPHPRGCRAPILLSGSSGGGKSWATAASMMFWQKNPGSWTDQSLPGSASDTYADAEVSISKTPIWVVDDLAPSEDDPTGTGKKASAVFTLMRHAHNGTSRGRRQSDMRAMDSNPPRALMFVSAEQTPEHQQSIMNRVIHIKVRSRQFLSESSDPTNYIEELGETTSPQSILTGYCLVMLARKARKIGWPKLIEALNDEFRFHEEQAFKMIGSGGEANRQARTIADLALGLSMLDWMMTELHMERQLADRLTAMRNDLYQAAKEGYRSSKETVLGSQFLSALRSTLRSHNAYVGAFGDAGVPMTSGPHGNWKSDADFTNDALGWMPGEEGQPARPCGNKIGDLVYDKAGNPCVVFEMKAAFAAVKRNHEGFRTHTYGEVWDSVIVQGYRYDRKTAGENGWSVRSSGGGASITQRVTRNGRQVEGVVISLQTLFDLHLDEDDDTDEKPQAA